MDNFIYGIFVGAFAVVLIMLARNLYNIYRVNRNFETRKIIDGSVSCHLGWIEFNLNNLKARISALENKGKKK